MCVTYREGNMVVSSPVTAADHVFSFSGCFRLQTHKSLNEINF